MHHIILSKNYEFFLEGTHNILQVLAFVCHPFLLFLNKILLLYILY